MFRNTFLLTAVAAAIAGCATTPVTRPLMTAPAPVTFDDHVAGQTTDYVFVLVADANPATMGLAMRSGESLRLAMPAVFKRNPSVAISSDTDVNLVLTKGWPQGSVPLAGQYRIAYDEKSNAMTVTASRDIASDGANAPGIKVIHLRGRTFVNPMPGEYPVTVTHLGADGKQLASWQGQLKVLDDAPSVRLAPANFSLPFGIRLRDCGSRGYEMINQSDAARYRRDRYLVVPGVLSGSEVAGLQRVTDEFVESSRQVSSHTEVFDPEPGHTAQSPRLGRIKTPRLYLVRLIVEFHGGTAQAHNIAGGVEVSFPVMAKG